MAQVRSLATVADTPAMDFAHALRAFEAAMVVAGLAELTRRTYRYELTRFWCDWCALRSVDVVTISRSEINAYIASLPDKGSKRGDAMRALKAFYRWARTEIRGDNPAAHLVIPRGRIEPAPDLTRADTVRLLSAAFRAERRRGWAILLCLATGARVGSLVGVRPDHVHLEDPEGPWIYFAIAKGAHPYDLPLSRAGVRACEHLLTLGHETLLGVGAARFRQWVHAAEETAHLPRCWPHLLRHHYATELARKTDPRTWQRGMNHADLSQYPRYVHTDRARLRQAYDS